MTPSAMEPMFPRDGKAGLTDLAVDLIARASHLSGQTQWTVHESIGDLVRSMNCYYSNLIEGHDTHPRDIDAALEDDYSPDPQIRILQCEARAHIEVQRLIDYGDDPEESPFSTTYIQWIHEEFCRRLPGGSRATRPNTGPGSQTRTRPGRETSMEGARCPLRISRRFVRSSCACVSIRSNSWDRCYNPASYYVA